jgi:hypothetical protein
MSVLKYTQKSCEYMLKSRPQNGGQNNNANYELSLKLLDGGVWFYGLFHNPVSIWTLQR